MCETKIDLLAASLIKAQSEIKYAAKTSKNPYFNSKYADLSEVIAAIKEPLNKNGIAFLQKVQSDDTCDYVITVLLHESGQSITSRTRVYCAKPNDPQAFGSGITYSKRYALQAILGLPTEDDDGNAAAANYTEPEKPNGKNGRPLLLSDKQKEFVGRVRELIEQNLDGGNPVDIDKLTNLLSGWAKTKNQPIPADESIASDVAGYILKNENYLKAIR